MGIDSSFGVAMRIMDLKPGERFNAIAVGLIEKGDFVKDSDIDGCIVACSATEADGCATTLAQPGAAVRVYRFVRRSLEDLQSGEMGVFEATANFPRGSPVSMSRFPIGVMASPSRQSEHIAMTPGVKGRAVTIKRLNRT